VGQRILPAFSCWFVGSPATTRRQHLRYSSLPAAAIFAPALAFLSAGDRCQSCNGACLVSEKKTFEVQVEQGMKHGQRIVLRGEAGCTEPGLTPGDVVLVVQQKPHDTFKRIQQANPADLLLEKNISLKEALCGYSFNVQHLDGRTLHVKTSEGQVIKPGSIMVVQNEGMPVHGRPFVKGNLYVKFEVGVTDEWMDGGE
jgi:DnaJ family protein A protein 2